jgi:hypothetical protein
VRKTPLWMYKLAIRGLAEPRVLTVPSTLARAWFNVQRKQKAFDAESVIVPHELRQPRYAVRFHRAYQSNHGPGRFCEDRLSTMSEQVLQPATRRLRTLSPASAGVFPGQPSERYKVTTDDVPYICWSRLPSASW